MPTSVIYAVGQAMGIVAVILGFLSNVGRRIDTKNRLLFLDNSLFFISVKCQIKRMKGNFG